MQNRTFVLNKSATFRTLGGSGGGGESGGRREGRGIQGLFMVSADQKLEGASGCSVEREATRLHALRLWLPGYLVCEWVCLGLRGCALAKRHSSQSPPARCFFLASSTPPRRRELVIERGKNGMATGQRNKITVLFFFLSFFPSAGTTSAPIRTNRAAPWVSLLAQRPTFV